MPMVGNAADALIHLLMAKVGCALRVDAGHRHRVNIALLVCFISLQQGQGVHVGSEWAARVSDQGIRRESVAST